VKWLRPLLQSPRQYLACALLWLLTTYPLLRWWKESVLFIAVMSLYTIVKSELVGATATELSDRDVDRVARRVVQLMRGEGEHAPPSLS
jgi:hypothetical protein